ncbi:Ionotropic receptor 75f [Frankliniella occidentalis]|nr:Ionotropic receptor 75f [Frankliniella occidentalis]
MVPGPRRAAAVAVLVLAAAGHLAGEDVAALAADLFAARGVRAVLVALRAGGPATFGVYRALSSDGRFQVSQTVGSTTVAHVLDTSERPYVGVVLEAGEPPPWFDPGDRAWFNGSYVWLVVDGDAAARTASWALRLDSEVFLAAQDDGDRAWRVDEVFRVNAEDAAVRRPFASWSPAGGLVAADPELAVAPVSSPGGDPLADRRTQFRRVLAGPRQLRVESSVYVRHKYHYTAMLCWRVRHHEHLISGELAAPPSGHFSGACGNVQRGVDDVVVTGLLMSDGRLQVFKYSATTYHFRSACLFLADGSLGSVDALLTPFTLLAWLAVGGVALAGMVLHKCFRHVEGDRIDWSESLLSTVGMFTGQGFASSGSWVSCQGLLIVSEVLFMLLDGYYNSTIVKSLLRPPPPSVRNVHDLLDSNYPVALNDWWLTVRNFQNASPGLQRDLYEKKIRPPVGLGYFPPSGLYKVLLRPLHAIIGSEESVYKSTEPLTASQACRLHELDVNPPQHIAPLVGRHCAFTELLFAGVLLQRERGVWQRVRFKWRQRRARCSGGGAHGEGDPIGLEPVLPLIALMVGGLLATAVVAVLERVAHRRSQRTRGAASSARSPGSVEDAVAGTTASLARFAS